MNRSEEHSLAWALIDVASRYLPAGTRTWLCTSIGAGDLDISIRTILSSLADNNVELSQDLVADLRRWLRGYEGTDSEHVLADLIGRLRVSTMAVQPPRPASPARLTTKRAFKPPHRYRQATSAPVTSNAIGDAG